MKSLLKPTRPSYEQVDAEDRYAQLSSRTDILSKSFTTDLWMKVITRAIDDVALYQFMREEGKQLKEEEIEFEESAKAFLFDENHHIPIDDYQVNINCPKCESSWKSSMSEVAGTDSICPTCKYKTSWKYTIYDITDNQIIKEISLKELISLWGVENIIGFRSGCKRRIQQIVDKKIKSSTKNTETKAINKKMISSNIESKTMPKKIDSITTNKEDNILPLVLKTIERERIRAETEYQPHTIESLKYIEGIISNLLNK